MIDSHPSNFFQSLGSIGTEMSSIAVKLQDNLNVIRFDPLHLI